MEDPVPTRPSLKISSYVALNIAHTFHRLTNFRQVSAAGVIEYYGEDVYQRSVETQLRAIRKQAAELRAEHVARNVSTSSPKRTSERSLAGIFYEGRTPLALQTLNFQAKVTCGPGETPSSRICRSSVKPEASQLSGALRAEGKIQETGKLRRRHRKGMSEIPQGHVLQQDGSKYLWSYQISTSINLSISYSSHSHHISRWQLTLTSRTAL
jgi:hypothetical protein